MDLWIYGVVQFIALSLTLRKKKKLEKKEKQKQKISISTVISTDLSLILGVVILEPIPSETCVFQRKFTVVCIPMAFH